MMSFRQWCVLLALYVVFMLGGAVMFLYLELWFEYEERDQLFTLKKHVIEVVEGLGNASRTPVEEVLGEVGEECGHDFLTLGEDEPLTWTLWNSFFFTFTVITTIGFGHMAPKTPWGRIVCILYAFIGVPLNGIVIASLADIFTSKVVKQDVRQWAARYKSWVPVLVDAVLYLVPGLLVFLVVPSVVLMFVEEDWSYLDSFYFSFITLTTIGFGDHVAGQQEREHVWMWVYKVVMVVWIIFGLGYIIMIITFVQRALKSKHVHNVERKMAGALKKHLAMVHNDLRTVRKAINSGAREKVHPEEGVEVTLKHHHHAPAGHTLTSCTPTPSSTPTKTPTTPLPRPRSASESDVSVPHLARLRDIEGMNIVLDLVERLMQQQETHALASFHRDAHDLFTNHHAHRRDEEEEEEERGHDNCAFEGDLEECRPVEEKEDSGRRRRTWDGILDLLLKKRLHGHLINTPTRSPSPTKSSPPSYSPTMLLPPNYTPSALTPPSYTPTHTSPAHSPPSSPSHTALRILEASEVASSSPQQTHHSHFHPNNHLNNSSNNGSSPRLHHRHHQQDAEYTSL